MHSYLTKNIVKKSSSKKRIDDICGWKYKRMPFYYSKYNY